jgi:serine/threonine protein kinase
MGLPLPGPGTFTQQVHHLLQQALSLPETARSAYVSRVLERTPDVGSRVASLMKRFDATPTEDTTLPDREYGPSTDRAPIVHGTVVDGFEVVRALGASGMGEVYFAERRHDALPVALKVLREDILDEITLERFRLEVEILASLTHEGIARLLGSGMLPDGRPYFVMEYVNGWPITDYCDRRRLGVDQRVELMREVCAVVHHAHEHLVIHRDLKPDNILVTTGGRPKLLDFGIAKVKGPEGERDVELTITGRVPATAVYASPEQLLGDDVAPPADVFSLGVVLYQLLCGKRPFTPEQTLARMVGRIRPRRPSEIVEDASLWRDRLEREAVAEARQTTVEGLVAALRAGLDLVATTAVAYQPSARQSSTLALATDLRLRGTTRPALIHS